jgi:hypothetical protein
MTGVSPFLLYLREKDEKYSKTQPPAELLAVCKRNARRLSFGVVFGFEY